MLALPKVALVALVLVSTLTSCGDDPLAANSGPTGSPSATEVTPTATPSSTPSVSASANSQASPSSSDCVATNKVVPDGTWRGPITMKVRGAGGQSGYAESEGTGRLTLTVTDGKVSGGTWTLTWKSHGEAETKDAAASVDLTGTVNGTAKGAAARPVLPHNWRIKGTAHVTRPVQTSAPFDETGSDQETMTIKTSTCAQVTGSFVPSFNSKETAATFTGTAEWIGTRR